MNCVCKIVSKQMPTKETPEKCRTTDVGVADLTTLEVRSARWTEVNKLGSLHRDSRTNIHEGQDDDANSHEPS